MYKRLNQFINFSSVWVWKLESKFLSENLGMPDTIVIGDNSSQSIFSTDFPESSK